MKISVAIAGENALPCAFVVWILLIIKRWQTTLKAAITRNACGHRKSSLTGISITLLPNGLPVCGWQN
jgi:hypothetical protein